MTTHAAPRPTPYFVHPLFDATFAGGLSLATFAFVFLFLPPGHSETAQRWAALVMWVVNWPHFSATLHRLFRRRANVAQYPATAGAVTVLVGAGVAVALLSPDLVAPYLVKLFLVWSPYHFSGQTMGISLLYARRAGVDLGGWPRRVLATFVFGTYVTSTLRAETGPAGASYFGIAYPGFGIPEGLGDISALAMHGAAGLFVLYMLHWSWRQRRLFPFLVWLPPLAQYAWFVAGAGRQPFYIFVPFFHSLQYLPIAWAMHLGERSAEGAERGRSGVVRTWAWRETARWCAVNFAGGIGLFWVIPHALALTGVPLDFATGVSIAGVQIHHFFVDGVIWKLRHPGNTRPLAASVLDYFRPSTSSVPARVAA